MPTNKKPSPQQQQQQTMKKKLNKGQHTQKVEHFKRKYRQPMKTISDQAARQFSHSQMIQLVEEKTLSLSSSLVEKKKCYPFPTESNIDPTLFLSNYSMISNKIFKQMLLTITQTTDTETNSLTKLFHNKEILTFTRQLTELMNKKNYFQLQAEQWAYYYNLGVTEHIWTGHVSKNMAIVNSMCHTYGRSKLLIEQRYKKHQKNLQMIEIDIDEHMKQIPSSVITNADQLIIIVTDLVYKDQYQLRMELERRRGLLKFDAKDHQLVHAFYNLKSRQTEIHSAKVIWKTIHDEQVLRDEINLFKNWLSSSKTSSLTLCTFQDLALTKINDIFTHIIFDKQLSPTTIPLKNNETIFVDQFIEDLTKETISTAETIVQHYIDKINTEKQKILSNREKFKKPPTVDTIITAIENRQFNMVQRAQYNIEQTLKAIFRTNINTTN